ncbi:metal ABC transporter solute-binding protein, Zn/Mn family [Paenibacillus thalictri]|uniref:ABC transporter substrate-binding protein n=1 Tax=Paenibacillus thalictri TaxID=2527873 RepID=A0A4V2J4T5_9BACL|nr:zinc ABC transporter substrate-binding protein [Paenibacillus thalictri]TBL81112.1 hypothetical protein EYB31_03195 [Paenibacillus thalictri]
MIKKSKWMMSSAVIALGISCLISGCGGAKQSNPESTAQQPSSKTDAIQVVASTSLMAYLAQAAGAKDVTFIAPAELKHPPEYDFRPSDVAKVKDAALVYAGYEPFMTKLIEATKVPKERLITVNVESTPASIIEAARGLAEKWGTQAQEKAWEAEFTKATAAIEEAAKKQNTKGKKVISQKFVTSVVKWMGYEVIAEYGPDELTPAKTAELAALKPDLIADNLHMPQGQSIADLAKAPRVEIRNYPDPAQKNLVDMLKGNASSLGVSIK